MTKTLVYVLLFANLAFFAWAGWIDVPPRGTSTHATANLPKLELVEAGRATTRPSPVAARSLADASRCVSVGPFAAVERAGEAALLLRERGFEPKQREEQGETRDGYWVYVGGLRNRLEQARVFNTLEQAGLNDARVMPDSGNADRRISVGLFSERVRAERRAQALRRLGLEPEIGERHVPATVYWLDLALGPNDSGFSAEGLLSPQETGAPLEVRVCPAVQSAPASG